MSSNSVTNSFVLYCPVRGMANADPYKNPVGQPSGSFSARRRQRTEAAPSNGRSERQTGMVAFRPGKVRHPWRIRNVD